MFFKSLDGSRWKLCSGLKERIEFIWFGNKYVYEPFSTRRGGKNVFPSRAVKPHETHLYASIKYAIFLSFSNPLKSRWIPRGSIQLVSYSSFISLPQRHELLRPGGSSIAHPFNRKCPGKCLSCFAFWNDTIMLCQRKEIYLTFHHPTYMPKVSHPDTETSQGTYISRPDEGTADAPHALLIWLCDEQHLPALSSHMLSSIVNCNKFQTGRCIQYQSDWLHSLRKVFDHYLTAVNLMALKCSHEVLELSRTCLHDRRTCFMDEAFRS